MCTKKLFIVILVMMLVFSIVACDGGSTSGGDNTLTPPETTPPSTETPEPNPDAKDPCPCCPDCIQEECFCEQCSDSDSCKCAITGGRGIWTVLFDNAVAVSPNRALPDLFVENYTLNFSATKAEFGMMVGSYSATEGYMANEMDPSGAIELSGGRVVYDDMGWDGPFSDSSFEILDPGDVTLPDDVDLCLSKNPVGISTGSTLTWSVSGLHFVVSTEGSGTAEMQEIYDLTYYIAVYSDGTAELYLLGTTAADILCFGGAINTK